MIFIIYKIEVFSLAKYFKITIKTTEIFIFNHRITCLRSNNIDYYSRKMDELMLIIKLN